MNDEYNYTYSIMKTSNFSHTKWKPYMMYYTI